MTKNKEVKVSRREQRRLQVEREQRARMLRIWLPIGLVVTLLAGLGIYQLTRPGVEGAIDFGAQLRGHDVAATFEGANELPPVGGVHHPTWQNCGIYATPVETSNGVHSMEHGAIWLAYHPDLDTDSIETLHDYAREDLSLSLVSPYENLKSPIVLTAWGVQLELESATDERIEQFINRYQGGGPEPGASCQGGLGVPLQ